VLKAFVPKLREQGKTVRIVAPTGRAALDINGSTTWTFAGWTPGHFKKPLEELRHNAHGKFVSKRFQETDVLVIDEISMVENHMLARLDAVLRAGRGYKCSDKPFGGLQLIVTGDFCQLPPVKPFQHCITCGKEQTQISVNGKTVYRCRAHGDRDDDDKWAFRSHVWESLQFKHINLSQIHRQSDEVFIKILQKLRVGTALSDADRTLLLDHPCDVTNAVKLFSTRNQVKQINDTEFNRLTTAKHSYTCLDYFNWNPEHRNLQFKGARDQSDDSLLALRDHKLDSRVELKTGMLVVLLVNLDIAAGLVNGSQGRILGFEQYLPSKLPKAAVRVEADGMGPTGGSKKKSSSGRLGSSQRRARESSAERTVTVQGELRGEHAALREEQIRRFLERPCNASKKWPLVEFDNGVRRTIFADCQVNELGDEQPYSLLARTQIPLIAAWAMTIHKSQGMTLNRVIVDLGSSFEEGQAYVALSRARSLEGLKVLSLGKEDGKGGNRQVKRFLWEKFGIR
jgi:ATP-dependent DNA helicase PIF1